MSRKTLLMIGMVVGSSAGSSVPMLWGGDWFSLSSIFFSFLGGIAGIWLAHKATA